MRATTTAGLLIWLAACGWLLAGDDKPDPKPGQTATDLRPIVLGYQATIHSSVLGEDRDILIYLPDTYMTSENAYPVIYLLDGRFNFQHTTSTVELLARLGHIPRMIVIAIANVDRRRDFTATVSPDTRLGGGAEPLLDFIEQELVPYVEQGFRTQPYRIIIGHSLGGPAGLQCDGVTAGSVQRLSHHQPGDHG
jgi:enterochelin esterase-like enzyme